MTLAKKYYYVSHQVEEQQQKIFLIATYVSHFNFIEA